MESDRTDKFDWNKGGSDHDRGAHVMISLDTIAPANQTRVVSNSSSELCATTAKRLLHTKGQRMCGTLHVDVDS